MSRITHWFLRPRQKGAVRSRARQKIDSDPRAGRSLPSERSDFRLRAPRVDLHAGNGSRRRTGGEVRPVPTECESRAEAPAPLMPSERRRRVDPSVSDTSAKAHSEESASTRPWYKSSLGNLRQHRTESPRDRGERSHPFTPGRFHVLLNSLSKVLFNFPSRYLSTIGLVPVFSLGWSLPPDLGCVPKQPDSRIEGRRSPSAPNGPGTRRGRPRSRELRTTRDETNGCLRPVRHTSRSLLLATGFGVGLLPVHSPLLRESRLVSFPPLSDMLKFSGSSRPSRGR